MANLEAFFVVAVDETHHCDRAWLRKHGVCRGFSLYLVREGEHTHLCEITPSARMEPVDVQLLAFPGVILDSYGEWTGREYVEEEWRKEERTEYMHVRRLPTGDYRSDTIEIDPLLVLEEDELGLLAAGSEQELNKLWDYALDLVRSNIGAYTPKVCAEHITTGMQLILDGVAKRATNEAHLLSEDEFTRLRRYANWLYEGERSS